MITRLPAVRFSFSHRSKPTRAVVLTRCAARQHLAEFHASRAHDTKAQQPPLSPRPSITPPGGNADGGQERRRAGGAASRLACRAVQGVVLLLALNVASDASGLSAAVLALLRGSPLNQDTFVPFAVAAREQVSPTAFVLTLRPAGRGGDGQPSAPTAFFRDTHADSFAAVADSWNSGGDRSSSSSNSSLPRFFYWPLFLRQSHAHAPVLAGAWTSSSIWSVEIRQPRLQVAREYTPLPPLYGREAADTDAGILRLLIRRRDGGEVSTYLDRLAVGDPVDLRGPHLGFDLRSRLGPDGASVVFLAGGTGVAPALQTIRAVLDYKDSSDVRDPPHHRRTVSLVWANRCRADADGDPIAAQLAEMQTRHPESLRVRCVVDEERSFITAADVPGAAKDPVGGGTSHEEKAQQQDCRRHAQKWVAVRPGRELLAEEEREEEACVCGGKNLLLVSGPDGFVEACAGPKRWAGGLELQGRVGGLIGRARQGDARFWRDWLVLKL